MERVMFYDNFVRLSVRKGILSGILDTILARFWHEKRAAHDTADGSFLLALKVRYSVFKHRDSFGERIVAAYLVG